jgi:ubiquinone/menaquinone biosynthesis C-methylase UbiE
VAWYRDHVFPALLDRACATAPKQRIRAEVCAPLAGTVLEIGFGTGLNLEHLTPAVERLLIVDPMRRSRRKTAARLAASAVAVEPVGLDGQSLDLADGSVDDVLSTWTLCSIADARAAIREVARVLRPGGRLHFAEHGRSPDASVRAWQDWLNGVQRRLAAGCNMNRDIPAVIACGGMTVTSLTTFYVEDDPKLVGWTYQGTAAVSGATPPSSGAPPAA